MAESLRKRRDLTIEKAQRGQRRSAFAVPSASVPYGATKTARQERRFCHKSFLNGI
jgi:hypothetical protein